MAQLSSGSRGTLVRQSRTTVVRLSYDSLASGPEVREYFGEKQIALKPSRLDYFASSLRHNKIYRDTRESVVRKYREKIRKTVVRKSHASEILALPRS